MTCRWAHFPRPQVGKLMKAAIVVINKRFDSVKISFGRYFPNLSAMMFPPFHRGYNPSRYVTAALTSKGPTVIEAVVDSDHYVDTVYD
jgi:hypothetical protein